MNVVENYSKIKYGDVILALVLSKYGPECINSTNIRENRVIIKLQKLTNTCLYKMIKYDNGRGFMWEKVR